MSDFNTLFKACKLHSFVPKEFDRFSAGGISNAARYYDHTRSEMHHFEINNQTKILSGLPQNGIYNIIHRMFALDSALAEFRPARKIK